LIEYFDLLARLLLKIKGLNMKILLAAFLGILVGSQSASAYRLAPFEGTAAQFGFVDAWRMYSLIPLSFPARIVLQWASQSAPANFFVAAASPPVRSTVSPRSTGNNTVTGNIASLVLHSPNLQCAGSGNLNLSTRPVITGNAVADGGSTLILLAGALGTLGWFQRRGRVQG
jgi:hypothetical protein